MILSAIGTALLVAFGFWIFGGFALRFGGALFALVGAVGLAITGDANGLLLVAPGALLWWTGHLHYVLRRGVWKSALAGSAFDRLRAVVWAGNRSDGSNLRGPWRDRQ